MRRKPVKEETKSERIVKDIRRRHSAIHQEEGLRAMKTLSPRERAKS